MNIAYLYVIDEHVMELENLAHYFPRLPSKDQVSRMALVLSLLSMKVMPF